MKILTLLAILLISIINVNAQEIGELAPEKDPIQFPPNAIGADIIFNNGGIGLGSFYKRSLSDELTFIAVFSIAESKNEKEFTRIDPFTYQTYTIGKKNRVFVVPVTFGMQYRLFRNSLYDNLRPFIEVGAGPSFVVTTPYYEEFFKSFGKAHNNMALGGYIGLGADFGINKSNLVALNIRYYVIHMFNDGVESLYGERENNLGGLYINLSLGIMY